MQEIAPSDSQLQCTRCKQSQMKNITTARTWGWEIKQRAPKIPTLSL